MLEGLLRKDAVQDNHFVTRKSVDLLWYLGELKNSAKGHDLLLDSGMIV